MSWYIESSALSKIVDTNEYWENTYEPGDTVPVSGIYRCLGCKCEITSNQTDPFPPQNHHQHAENQGKIRWILNVRTNTKGE